MREPSNHASRFTFHVSRISDHQGRDNSSHQRHNEYEAVLYLLRGIAAEPENAHALDHVGAHAHVKPYEYVQQPARKAARSHYQYPPERIEWQPVPRPPIHIYTYNYPKHERPD